MLLPALLRADANEPRMVSLERVELALDRWSPNDSIVDLRNAPITAHDDIVVTVYGDTLASVTSLRERRRQWYSIGSDTLLWLGEDRRVASRRSSRQGIPQRTIHSSTQINIADSLQHVTSLGERSKTGSRARMAPHHGGLLLIAPDDTLRYASSVENTLVDSIATDEGMKALTTRSHRYYLADSRFPVVDVRTTLVDDRETTQCFLYLDAISVLPAPTHVSADVPALTAASPSVEYRDGALYISAATHAPSRVVVSDIMGRVWHTATVDGGAMPLPSLPAGVYHARISNGNNQQVVTFTVGTL